MSNISLTYSSMDGSEEEKTLTFSSDLIQEPYNKNALFVSKVQGESMQPLIQNQSLVVADLSNKTLINKAIYLIQHKNNMWIKQASFNKNLQHYEFVSINSAYSHLVFGAQEVRVIAKVVLTF